MYQTRPASVKFLASPASAQLARRRFLPPSPYGHRGAGDLTPNDERMQLAAFARRGC
jgi:hypothetical protein